MLQAAAATFDAPRCTVAWLADTASALLCTQSTEGSKAGMQLVTSVQPSCKVVLRLYVKLLQGTLFKHTCTTYSIVKL
jgi:hypothetical protein